jgi:hypothetical protein
VHIQILYVGVLKQEILFVTLYADTDTTTTNNNSNMLRLIILALLVSFGSTFAPRIPRFSRSKALQVRDASSLKETIRLYGVSFPGSGLV